MNSKFLFRFFLLGTVLIFSFYSHFSNLNWGTPSQEKTSLIFSNPSELQSLVPKMIELRNKYYDDYQVLLNPKSAFKETFQSMFGSHLKNPYFGPLPQDLVLDRTRGYLIGTLNNEEQNTMMGVSNLNPFKLDFNPGVNVVYGGLFYYTCAASLAFGKVLGSLSLTPDISYYFTHPDEIGKMYLFFRLVGALSVIISALFLFFWISRLRGFDVGILSLLFFSTIPLLYVHSHRTGAHTYGMLLFLVGFFFLWRYVEQGNSRQLFAGSFFLGLCAASVIYNLTVGIVIFIAEGMRSEWNLKKLFSSSRFWIACLFFFALYGIFNYYVFAHFDEYKRYVMAMKEYMDGYGEHYGALDLHLWIPFLKDMFTNQLHWLMIPFLLAGIVFSAISKDRFYVYALICFGVLLFLNLLITRHAGVNTRNMPLVAILCAVGFQFLFRVKPIGAKVVVIAVTFAAIGISGLQSYYNVYLLKQPDHHTLAGKWVNMNIPKGSRIGVVGGQIAHSNFPPFEFLKYNLVRFPNIKEISDYSEKDLPEYVIFTLSKHPILDQHYTVIQSWFKPTSLLGISFPSNLIATGNIDFFIFKKNEEKR